MGKPLRILLVDDDEDEFVLTQELLADRSFRSGEEDQVGFKLDWVGTYEAALEAFETQDYDVYLVDYHLGRRDGLELLREASARGCTAPIILMTGQGSYSVDVEAMKVGATDYLNKGELTAPLLERTIRYALERKRTEEEIRHNAARAELLALMSHAFAQAGLDYAGVLNTVAQRVAESSGDAVIIRMLTEDRRWLEPVAYYHPDPNILATLRESLLNVPHLASKGMAGRVFKTGLPLLISDLDSHEAKSIIAQENAPSPDQLPYQSALTVPLRAQGASIGTLSLIRFQSGKPYTLTDQNFYQDLADRAALAIENARLYATITQRARELDALRTATAELLTTIDLEILLSHILDVAQSAIPAAEKGLLYLIAPDTGKLQIRATSGFHDPRIKKVQFPKGRDYPARAVRERLPILVHDIVEDKNVSDSILTQEFESIRSAVIAPMLLEDEVIGVLSLSASRPDAFTEADLRLLVSFATTTTAAIHNARLHAEVQKMAVTDGLTEFYNRRGFFDLSQHEFERARRFNRPLSAIMVDVDQFKEINDSYGHAVGDHALRVLAGRLRSAVRELDILGRYGGDELVILLPETDLYTACAIAERIRQRIAEPITLSARQENPVSFEMTVSLGVAHLLPDTQDLNALLQRADSAAYLAKREGRNRVEVA